MDHEPEKLIAALSFALSICRGELADALSGERLNPQRVHRILDGTSNESISQAIGCAVFSVDWRLKLSQDERDVIENEYGRFYNATTEQPDGREPD